MSQAIVELRNVNIYQSSNLILSEVNISIDKGEFVYLVGKTGTGKSSLLKTLYGDLTLTEGEGSVVGYNLRELDWKKVPFLRRSLGVVFQDFQLLTDRNVNENLKFVLKATGWKDENLMNEKSDNGPIGCNPNEINDIELTAYINNMKTGVMKTLADTMEALIGAIFIDSQGNLETIKKCLMHIKLI